MRQLSRLLSVFLALILMGLSFLTVAAHEATGNVGKDIVRVTVERTDDKDPVYPGDELEFTVIVELLIDHTIGGTTTTDGGNLYGPDYDKALADADAATGNRDKGDVDLSSTVSYIAFEKVKYKVRGAEDLGSAASRTATLTWTFTFNVEGTGDSEHATPQTATGSVEVEVMKRPAAEGGATQMELDFSASTVPDEIARGKEVTFKLTATTGDYKVVAKTLVIKKQLYEADGDKKGNLVSVGSFAIPELDSNSESASLVSTPKTYKLLQSEVDEIEDGGKLEFSYSHVITESEVLKAGTDTSSALPALTETASSPIALLTGDNAVRIDLDSSGDHGSVNADGEASYDSVKLEGTIITVEMAAPEAEATPEPYIGMNDAAKVMQGDGNIIHITFADGSETSVGVGALTAMGVIDPHPNGYVRDSDLGQTYAVVQRTDGMVVRKWISSASPLVSQIDWASVNTSYTFSAEAVNAIPLDGMHPSENQLVKVGMHIYVNLAGEWWHIPDIPTFEARSYYWCDVTSADERFETYVMNAPMLPSAGGSPTPGYPSCR
ncbi:MAG: hypothetical protein OXE05_12120 [Chloroflexi bacterium]|nr:hypothetical protein [Chloroflexota bacterium]